MVSSKLGSRPATMYQKSQVSKLKLRTNCKQVVITSGRLHRPGASPPEPGTRDRDRPLYRPGAVPHAATACTSSRLRARRPLGRRTARSLGRAFVEVMISFFFVRSE